MSSRRTTLCQPHPVPCVYIGGQVYQSSQTTGTDQSETESPRVSPHPLSDHWSAIEPPTKSMEEIIQSLQNHAYIKNMYQNPCLPYSCVNQVNMTLKYRTSSSLYQMDKYFLSITSSTQEPCHKVLIRFQTQQYKAQKYKNALKFLFLVRVLIRSGLFTVCGLIHSWDLQYIPIQQCCSVIWHSLCLDH